MPGLKVYTSGNYIITDNGSVMHEFAKGYTTYSYNQTSQTFTIRESVGGSFTITRTQLLAGDIVDESSVAYTFNSFVTFLRENTGFKTAPGGSGASSTEVINLSSTDILNLASTPIELLPAPGANNYYDVKNIIIEYTYGSAVYDVPSNTWVKVYFQNLGHLSATPVWIVEAQTLFEQASNRVVIAERSGKENTISTYPRQTEDANSVTDMNSPLLLWVSQGVGSFSPGNGTAKVYVTYETRTFGA